MKSPGLKGMQCSSYLAGLYFGHMQAALTQAHSSKDKAIRAIWVASARRSLHSAIHHRKEAREAA